MKFLTTTAIALSLMASAGCAQAQSTSTANRAEIEAVIKDYLMKNPEIVQQALDELVRKEEAAMMAFVREAIENDNIQRASYP